MADNIDDDDSENDSDYVPEPEGEETVDNVNTVTELKGISASKKRKVDSLWEEMQQLDKRETADKMNRTVSNIQRDGATDSKLTSSKRRKTVSILSNIFGKTVAQQMINSSAASAVSHPSSSSSEATTATAVQSDIRRRALESVKKIARKTKLTETRKFAGQSISVTRTVMAATAPEATKEADTVNNSSNSNSNSSSGGGGLDGVLDTLKGPKLVSTVAKSSMDWDNYKDQEGLDDKLQAASKEGYLARKEFLERVDVRAYENEKADRANTAR